jgi:hypothetical protein
MWLLHFLPDAFLAFVVDAVLISGVVATILTCFLLKHLIRLVPVLAPHVKIAQIVSVLLLLSGVYFKGGYSSEMAWRERVREMEAKVAQAEQQSQAANVVIDKKGTEKIRIIREKGEIIKQYVDREITKYDNTCVIPTEVVRAHNAAARNEEIK